MLTSLDKVKPLSLFKERDFALLLTGQFISALGDKIHYIALGVWVYRLTGSPLEVGKMTVAALLPYLLYGLVAGVYVDRWDKKRTMIISDLLRALLVVSIPAIINISVNLVYLLTFLITTISMFFNPAKMSVIPSLFPREKILAATSLAESVENITEILGYALAGLVAALISMEQVFYLDAVTFLISAFIIMGMDFKSQESVPGKTRVFQDVKEGLYFIRNNETLLVTLAVYCLVLLVFSGFNPLIFVYALESLGVSAFSLGVLEAMHAVGITFGGLALSFWGSRVAKGQMIIRGYLISGATIALLGIFPSYPLALVGFFFTGLSNAMFFIPIQAIFQELTPAAMRGRVFSARFAFTRIALMSSVALLTFIASETGVEKVYMISGLILVLIALVTRKFKAFQAS